MSNTLELTSVLPEGVPATVLAKSLDEAMFDYAVLSIKDEQSVPAEKAIEHIKHLKLIRDALLQCNIE